MKPIEGVIPIAATPFTSRGVIDEDSFQSLIRHMLTKGVHGITLFGTASEAYKLSDNEKRQLMEIFFRETAYDRHVVAGVCVSDHSVELAILTARQAESAGADYVMLSPPHFLQPSLEAVAAHFKAVSSAVSLPVVLQYAPAQMGLRLPPQLFAKLHQQCGGTICVKVECQPPGRYISALLEESRGELKSLVGYAGIQMPDAFRRGAVGVQPGSGSVEVYLELYAQYQTGHTREFDRLFRDFLPFISYWMQSVELTIQATKVVLHKRGIIATDYCRTPGYSLDRLELDMIEEYLERFNPYLT